MKNPKDEWCDRESLLWDQEMKQDREDKAADRRLMRILGVLFTISYLALIYVVFRVVTK